MLTIEVKGTEEIIKNILEVDKKLSSDDVKEYLAQKMLDVINRISKEKLNSSDNYIEHNNYKLVPEGILLYNDVQNDQGQYYSLIVEYGSGTYAEGQSFHHTKSYENSGGLYWLVPVEEGSSLMNTDFDIITLDSGDYFKVYGQQAKHIYTDAAKEIEKNVKSWLKEYIDKVLGGKST